MSKQVNQQEEPKVDVDFGSELDIEQKPEIEPTEQEPVVLNDTQLDEMTEDLATDMKITDFTAPQSNINHGHDTDKHDVRSAFGVRDAFVSSFFSDFGIAPNDHAAIWLLHYRQDEAIAHDEPVFEDTHDTDKSRWSQISQRRTDAPIAPETQEALQK